MKKKYIFMLLILLFSFIAQVIPAFNTVHAETTKQELINEKFLKISYDYEPKEDSNRWRIMFSRQCEDADKKEILKLKVMNEEGDVVTYPTIDGMTEKDGWLLEKDFSSSPLEGQLVFELPKSIHKLHLEVQMDEQTLSENRETVVKENILSGKNSFVLEVADDKNSTKSKNESSDSKATAKTSSSQMAGPQLKSVASLPENAGTGVIRSGALDYKNKVPDYTDGEIEGSKYPTYSWTPTGQSNVINHQGGYENDEGWDGKTGWDVKTDNNQAYSYIYYGYDESNKADSNIAMRKYASEIEGKDDQFNIRLNVRGNTVAKPGVDVCLVLDTSGSMRDKLKDSSITKKKVVSNALNGLIGDLKKINAPSGMIRVGSVLYSNPKTFPKDETPTVPLSGNKADWDNIISKFDGTVANGQTYTQGALMLAQTMLDGASGSNRRKVIFLLTDGAPNYSATPEEAVSNSDIYYDLFHITKYDEDSKKIGEPFQEAVKDPNIDNMCLPTKISKDGGYTLSGTGQKMTSHLTPANSTAADIKASGIEINTVAIDIRNPYAASTNEHSSKELMTGMYRMATKKNGTSGTTKDDYQFFNATEDGEIGARFDDWFDSIVETVNKGTIDDPIGDMYDLVSTPTVKDLTKDANDKITSANFPNIVSSDPRKVQVNNINLHGGQEIQIDYTVRLRTSDPNYSGGVWYQTNKKTTLTPEPERSNNALEFGSPSARGKVENFDIPVEKAWSDKDDNWGLRPDSIEVVLQRKNGSSWEDVATKNLSAEGNWKDTFTAVKGALNVYHVVEKAQIPGYAKPTYTEFTHASLPSGGIKLTNNLLTGTATFYKYKNDGKTPFSDKLPTFSVKRKSDSKVLATNLKPDENGLETISDIPVGEFTVEETDVPPGYAKMSDITLKAVTNSSGTGLDITLDDRDSPIQVTNKLNDFTLTVNKKDQAGADLEGASIRLQGVDYDQTVSVGSSFVFNKLRPGEYELAETKTPDGYKELNLSVRISISENGEVEIQDHPNVKGVWSIGEDKNSITLTVKNEKMRKGQLPETGGPGTKKFLKITIGASISALGLTGCYYWIHIKRKDP